MEKKKKGRQAIMDSTLKMVAVNLAENHGLTDKEIASSLGICETTIHNTKKYDPDFFKALKDAKETFCNNLVEDSLLKRCLGLTVREIQTRIVDGKEIKTIIDKQLPPDPASLTLYLRNKLPHLYNKEKINHSLEIHTREGLSRESALEILRNDPFARATEEVDFSETSWPVKVD